MGYNKKQYLSVFKNELREQKRNKCSTLNSQICNNEYSPEDASSNKLSNDKNGKNLCISNNQSLEVNEATVTENQNDSVVENDSVLDSAEKYDEYVEFLGNGIDYNFVSNSQRSNSSLNNDHNSTLCNSLDKSSEIGLPNFDNMMFTSQDKATAELIDLFDSVGAPMYLYDRTIFLIKKISKMDLKFLMLKPVPLFLLSQIKN